MGTIRNEMTIVHHWNNDLPNCQHTDAEIAKSFIEDVEAVKDHLPTTKNDLEVDAVSRKDVHDMLENLPVTVENKWFNWLQKACMRLAELPSVTPQEPRKGHWESIKGNFESYVECSICGKCSIDQRTYVAMNFCPFCGADMREVEE